MRQAYLGQTRPSIYYLQSDRWGSLTHAKTKSFRYEGHRWTGPTVVNEHLYGVVMAPSDRELYFEDGDTKHIWRSERTKDGWTASKLAFDEPFGIYGFTPTTSGNIYISTTSDAEDKKRGITDSFSMMSVSAGGPKIHSLGVPLNEPGVNSDFFVAPDESYMIVSAKETKSFQCELYISFRRRDSTWTVPVSLGAED